MPRAKGITRRKKTGKHVKKGEKSKSSQINSTSSHVSTQFSAQNISTIEQNTSVNQNRELYIIRGRFNQSDARFSNGGTQCTAVAAAALIYKRCHNEIGNLNEDAIDDILITGDNYYRLSMSRRQVLEFGNRLFLATDELLTQGFQMFNHEITLHISNNPLNGHLINDDFFFRNLINSLNIFFSNNDQGLFICNEMSVAIFKENNYYYLFDSHSRDSHGLAVPDGTSCMIRFNHLNFLHDHMISIFFNENSPNETSNQFELVGADITTNQLAMDIDPIEIINEQIQQIPMPSSPFVEHPPLDRNNFSENVLQINDATHIPVNILSTFRIAKSLEVNYSSVGDLNKICPNCNAYFFPNENFFCCNKGKIVLPNADTYPPLLFTLLTGEHPNSAHFIDNIRKYNNALAFASIRTPDLQQRNLRPGPPVYVISGRMYHSVRDINLNGTNVQYGGLYFVDASEASNIRAGNIAAAGISTTLMESLDLLLRSVNPYAAQFQSMREKLNEERRKAAETGAAIPELSLLFYTNPRIDRRTHNAPTNANEIGVVFSSADGNVPAQYSLRVYLRDAEEDLRFLEIPKISPHADPLCYPILFPLGTLGWAINLPLRGIQRGRISMREFYCYRFMVRDIFNPCLQARKLTQQYITDAYVKVESDRINFIRKNQRKLRAENYSGLQDYVQNIVQNNANLPTNVGRIVILPGTFTAGPRFMMQEYQNSMAIVARFGRPSLFITVTCNPRWPEITKYLRPNQNAEDRPDIVCRVFNLKLQEVLNDITKRMVFGRVMAYVYVIEFQKRGLPHAHMLITLRPEDRYHTEEDINSFISAEIPDATLQPELHDLVKKTMIHGPCDSRNPGVKNCHNEEGQCSKKYPKRLQNTSSAIPGQPVYYRRRPLNEPVEITRNNRVLPIDNKDVVPYNPWLLRKYESHINVEITSSTKCCKYIFKYITKGADGAVMQISETGVYDETASFVESRYISSCESYWRLAEFKMHGRSHTVKPIPVHLPNQRVILFEEDQEGAAVEVAQGKRSMLEAFFELNKTDQFARSLLYLDIPYHYRFIESKSAWQKRQKYQLTFGDSNLISRMYVVSPKYVELFHLRLLLLYVRGAKSFEDMRTYNDIVYNTFQEAAVARGLTASDAEWDRTLAEAALKDMPGQIRKLFAYILIFCEVSQPVLLWEKYKEYMIEDYVRKGMSVEMAEAQSLRRINQLLIHHNTNLTAFGFPEINSNSVVDNVVNDDEDQQQNPILTRSELDIQIAMLNSEQRTLYNRLCNTINDNSCQDRYFFLQGSGGTGKTFLYNILLDTMAVNGVQAISVAFTGIAALLLRNGRTAHSTFRLPLNLTEESTSSISAQSEEANRLRAAKLLIWDEVTMTSKYALDAVDRLLQDVRNDRRPFGGICVILGGDVKQLIPIPQPPFTQEEILFVKSISWPYFRILHLTINMRVLPGQQQFADWCEKLGRGLLRVESNNILPYNCINIMNECIVRDVVEEVYRDLNVLDENSITHCMSNRIVLCVTNDDVAIINDRMITRFPGNETIILSADSVVIEDETDNSTQYPQEYLNSIKVSGLPDHRLVLKKGLPIVLLRNLSTEDGLMNGTRLIVVNVTQHILSAKIAVGINTGREVMIPRMDLTSQVEGGLFKLKRRQFPVKVCFALTINKSQGQTFDLVGIFLNRTVFAHGQLYVAFSRARSWETVKVQLTETQHQGRLLQNNSRIFTLNVVLRSLLDLIYN